MLVIRIYLPYSTLYGKKQDEEGNPGGYFENQQLCHQPVHGFIYFVMPEACWNNLIHLSKRWYDLMGVRWCYYIISYDRFQLPKTRNVKSNSKKLNAKYVIFCFTWQTSLMDIFIVLVITIDGQVPFPNHCHIQVITSGDRHVK